MDLLSLIKNTRELFDMVKLFYYCFLGGPLTPGCVQGPYPAVLGITYGTRI